MTLPSRPALLAFALGILFLPVVLLVWSAFDGVWAVPPAKVPLCLEFDVTGAQSLVCPFDPRIGNDGQCGRFEDQETLYYLPVSSPYFLSCLSPIAKAFGTRVRKSDGAVAGSKGSWQLPPGTLCRPFADVLPLLAAGMELPRAVAVLGSGVVVRAPSDRTVVLGYRTETEDAHLLFVSNRLVRVFAAEKRDYKAFYEVSLPARGARTVRDRE